MSRNKNLFSVILSVILSIVCVAAAASAATTISTNISTDGTLTVTGLTTLGNASTSVLSVSGNSYLGTVSSGTWSGTAIGVTKGGTGLASYTANQLLYASGATTIGQIATSSLGLLTTNVAEGTNLYWTDTRFDNRLSATTTLPNITTLAGLTTLGTIGTGVWQGTAIADAYIPDTITASNYLPLTGGTLTGNLLLPPAYSLDVSSAGVLNIGTTTANAITIGKSGVTTTFPGDVTVSGTFSPAQTTATTFAVGGGYGSTGATIDATGKIQLNGDLEVNGKATTTAASGNIATEGSLTIGAGTAITKHLSATASLTFGTIAANDCSTQTLTATGAVDGNVVSLGVPDAVASASTTLVWSGWVSAADTVSVRVCQVAAQGTSPISAATVRADVWQH